MATLVFFIVAYSLAFLIADASIFGVSTQAFLQKPEDVEYNRNKGVLRFRYYLLRVPKIQEFLSCYFCLGFWTGALAHLLIYLLSFYIPDLLTSYILLNVGISTIGVAISTLVAALVSAPACLFANLIIELIELKVERENENIDLTATNNTYNDNDPMMGM